MKRPAGILFDLDGTLVDSEPAHWETARAVLADAGAHLPDAEAAHWRGCAEDAFFLAMKHRFRLTAPPQAFARRRSMVFLEHLRGRSLDLLPRVEELLARLGSGGVPLAIASASPRAQIEAVTRATGLDRHFPVRVSGHDDVRRSKPAPDVYREAARRLGAAPEDCWAVEDSVNGALAAVASGARTFVVPSVEDPAFGELPVTRLASLAELPLLD